MFARTNAPTWQSACLHFPPLTNPVLLEPRRGGITHHIGKIGRQKFFIALPPLLTRTVRNPNVPALSASFLFLSYLRDEVTNQHNILPHSVGVFRTFGALRH